MPAGQAVAQQVTPGPQGYAMGLPIGWNSSTGPTTGQCLNYTIAPLSNNLQQTTFSSQNTANSSAQQINVSASVSLSFDLFQANDSFSFSDQWQSSTNSNNQYFNIYSLYRLNSTVDPSNPLTTQGTQARDSFENFNTLCGKEYLSSVEVGMVATLSLNYGSSSESTEQEITNKLEVEFGLDSVSAAVEVASQDQSSTSYFTFSMTQYGGGTEASQKLHDAFSQVNAQGQAFYALCAQGDSEACTTFSSNMAQGTSEAFASFNGRVAALNTATNPDLSFLQTFPTGVAGAVTPQPVTSPIPPSNPPFATDEVLAPYKGQLEEVVTLLNQIVTLKNRVQLLIDLFRRSPDSIRGGARSDGLSERPAHHLRWRSRHAARESEGNACRRPASTSRRSAIRSLPIRRVMPSTTTQRMDRATTSLPSRTRSHCSIRRYRSPRPCPHCRWTFSTLTSCRHLQGWRSRCPLRIRQRS